MNKKLKTVKIAKITDKEVIKAINDKVDRLYGELDTRMNTHKAFVESLVRGYDRLHELTSRDISRIEEYQKKKFIQTMYFALGVICGVLFIAIIDFISRIFY